MAVSEPAVFVRRGKVVESTHRVSLAVSDARGKLHARLGDPGLVTFTRSSAKPFQALALVASGAADGLSAAELAIVTGSHGGEDRHVKTVEGILAQAGIPQEALRCGTHKPYHPPTAERIAKPSVLHHNCSGKHTGMLLLAQRLGVPLEDYIDPASAGQRRIRKVFADVCGLKPAQVRLGTDGCSAPNFAVPVRSAARAFALLGAPEGAHAPALTRIRDAMLAHPEMVAGELRFDTDLMARAPVLSKSGAEGYVGIAWPAKGLGLALKVEDGNQRAVAPAAVEALRQLRAIRAKDIAGLEPHLQRVQKNWAGLVVGGVEPRFRLR
ncbi:MAG: asparaginase [Halobacteriales archaeon]|nr:asparaginase [Halobacteriales archaeon]